MVGESSWKVLSRIVRSWKVSDKFGNTEHVNPTGMNGLDAEISEFVQQGHNW